MVILMVPFFLLLVSIPSLNRSFLVRFENLIHLRSVGFERADVVGVGREEWEEKRKESLALISESPLPDSSEPNFEGVQKDFSARVRSESGAVDTATSMLTSDQSTC